MTVIDLSEQIDDICIRYPKYWHWCSLKSGAPGSHL